MCASFDSARGNDPVPAMPSMQQLVQIDSQIRLFLVHAAIQCRRRENRLRGQPWQLEWGLVAPESTLESDWPGAGECRASRR
jgi:hypothetical protein